MVSGGASASSLGKMNVRRYAVLAHAGLVASLLPANATARDLEYAAPAGCPSRAEVAARIDKAAPRGRRARITVVKDEILFRGEVVVGEGEDRLARTITAQTCDALVDELTLVVALDQGPREDEAHPRESRAASPTPEPEPQRPPPDAPARAPKSGWRPAEIALGAGGVGSTWHDKVMPGAAVFGELALRRGAWEPSARLALAYVFPTEVQSNGVSLAMTTAGIDLCPLAFGGDMSRTSVCGRVDVGIVDASADGIGSDNTRWLAGAGLVEERLTFGEPGVPRPFVEIAGGVVAPLTRHRFFSADDAGNDVPVVQWTLALAGGVVLP